MDIYSVYITPEANQDLLDLYNYIAEILKAPATAIDYYFGALDTINNLSVYGGSVAICQREYIQRLYGPNARTVVYKKMTIVFNVINDTIVIRCVMASSLVI